jgi:branched-chain amino acid transport system ATP-binding protein
MPELSGGLQTNDLTVRYGGVVANNAVSIAAKPGEITGLIGPNGAGKTSFVDAITGFTPYTGDVTVHGQSLAGLPVHRRTTRGLVRTWQAGDLFDDVTVAQNLEVALEGFRPLSPWSDLVGRRHKAQAALIEDVLTRLRINHVRDRRPGEVSLGERRLVGVARALVMSPKVLLLDEPAAGLDSRESEQLGATIAEIAEEGTAVLLIEHDIDLVLKISSQVYVLDYGRLIASGPPAHIRQDSAVVAAYLGEPTPVEASHEHPA